MTEPTIRPSKWEQRVIKNLAPLSTTNEFPELLTEWFATRKIWDNETAEFECGVCDHKHLRFWHQIKNIKTGKYIDTSGSQCILEFPQIGVEGLDGKIYYGAEREVLLEDLKRQLKQERIAAVRKETAEHIQDNCGALDKPSPGYIRNLAERIIKAPSSNGLLTTKEFSTLLWGASTMGTSIPANEFQGIINLRKDKAKQDLAGFPEWRVKKLLPYLTDGQMEIYKKLAA